MLTTLGATALTSKHLIGERGNAHEAPAEREGLPGRMPMGAGFFEKARADSGTWDLGLATNEGKLFGLSPPAAYVVSARNASLHLLASFQLRMPNAYYLVLEANRQKLTLRVSLPALEAKHSARRPGPFAFGTSCGVTREGYEELGLLGLTQRQVNQKKMKKRVVVHHLVEAEAKNKIKKESGRMNAERGPASKNNSPSFERWYSKSGFRREFRISYMEADRELPELVLAVAELPN
ncbi:hypothetical protein EZV62_028274 [Acer yangbiense]|uniref:Uncharacterized protein n=1 Tax=Acer yangbiense TaxID=1000413 RepID=A0A5C7GNV6_9ROSI|nr:hypothetical protein EZV62_028274 [Acer yangbiense]